MLIGGALNFFQVGVCGPDFRSVGLANCYLPLKMGACELKISQFRGLWTENFPIWRLASWKFPNLEACELKFGWKMRLLRLKFPNFLKRGSWELTFLREMRPSRTAEEAWKGGLQGRTSPYPISRSVPPGVLISTHRWLSFIQLIIGLEENLYISTNPNKCFPLAKNQPILHLTVPLFGLELVL